MNKNGSYGEWYSDNLNYWMYMVRYRRTDSNIYDSKLTFQSLKENKDMFSMVLNRYPLAHCKIIEEAKEIWLGREFIDPNLNCDTEEFIYDVKIDFNGAIIHASDDWPLYEKLFSLFLVKRTKYPSKNYDLVAIDEYINSLENAMRLGIYCDPCPALRAEFSILGQMAKLKDRPHDFGTHCNNFYRLIVLLEKSAGNGSFDWRFTGPSADGKINIIKTIRKRGWSTPDFENGVKIFLENTKNVIEKHKCFETTMEHMKTVPETVNSSNRVIDLLMQEKAMNGVMTKPCLLEVLKRLGYVVDSKKKINELWDFVYANDSPKLREVMGNVMGSKWLKPVEVDIHPLEEMKLHFHKHAKFPSEEIVIGRADNYFYPAYLKDKTGRLLFIGFGRDRKTIDGNWVELRIDACVFLKGEYFIKPIPRITFWRQRVNDFDREHDEKYKEIFFNFVNIVKRELKYTGGVKVTVISAEIHV